MIKHKALIISAILLLQVGAGFAQGGMDSMLLQQTETKSDIINKARNVLLDAVDSNDKAKAQTLQQYLNANYGKSNYVGLYPAENMLLFYWVGLYDSIPSYSELLDTLYSQTNTKIYPTSGYNFYSLLQEKVKKEKEEIKSDIRTSTLTEVKKEFLVIYLDYSLFNSYRFQGDKLDSALKALQVEVLQFKTSYPNTTYAKQFEFNLQEWGNWGVTLGIGGGYAAYTKNLASDFKNTGLLSMNIAVSYKHLVTDWGILIGGSDTKKNLIKNNVMWEKGSRASYAGTSLTLGWRFFEKSRVLLTPFAGIGVNFISPPQHDEDKRPELKEVDYTFGPVIPMGLNIDLRIGKMAAIIGQDIPASSFYALRLNYTFNYQGLADVPSDFSGNMHIVTLNFQMFGRPLKPVKS